MKIKNRLSLIITQIVAICAIIYAGSSAYSSCSGGGCSGDASIQISGSRSVSQDASLNFGNVIPPTSATPIAGREQRMQITINHVNGSRTKTDNLSRGGQLNGGSPSRGIFTLTGYTCQGNGGTDCTGASDVQSTLDSTTTLTCSSGCGASPTAITVDLTSQGAPVVESGNIKMYIGGTAYIPVNQAAGTYTGQYNITFTQN